MQTRPQNECLQANPDRLCRADTQGAENKLTAIASGQTVVNSSLHAERAGHMAWASDKSCAHTHTHRHKETCAHAHTHTHTPTRTHARTDTRRHARTHLVLVRSRALKVPDVGDGNAEHRHSDGSNGPEETQIPAPQGEGWLCIQNRHIELLLKLRSMRLWM